MFRKAIHREVPCWHHCAVNVHHSVCHIPLTIGGSWPLCTVGAQPDRSNPYCKSLVRKAHWILETKPLPPPVSLQYPVLATLSIMSAGKGEIFTGPISITVWQAMKYGFRAERQYIDNRQSLPL